MTMKCHFILLTSTEQMMNLKNMERYFKMKDILHFFRVIWGKILPTKMQDEFFQVFK